MKHEFGLFLRLCTEAYKPKKNILPFDKLSVRLKFLYVA